MTITIPFWIFKVYFIVGLVVLVLSMVYTYQSIRIGYTSPYFTLRWIIPFVLVPLLWPVAVWEIASDGWKEIKSRFTKEPAKKRWSKPKGFYITVTKKYLKEELADR